MNIQFQRQVVGSKRDSARLQKFEILHYLSRPSNSSHLQAHANESQAQFFKHYCKLIPKRGGEWTLSFQGSPSIFEDFFFQQRKGAFTSNPGSPKSKKGAFSIPDIAMALK